MYGYMYGTSMGEVNNLRSQRQNRDIQNVAPNHMALAIVDQQQVQENRSYFVGVSGVCPNPRF